jgi:CRP-like cAMP-binding protein
VAKALLILIEKFGLNNELNIIGIEELNRQDIAELVGLNSNQVTKVLAEFKEDNIIETDNKKIKILNQKKLEIIISI